MKRRQTTIGMSVSPCSNTVSTSTRLAAFHASALPPALSLSLSTRRLLSPRICFALFPPPTGSRPSTLSCRVLPRSFTPLSIRVVRVQPSCVVPHPFALSRSPVPALSLSPRIFPPAWSVGCMLSSSLRSCIARLSVARCPRLRLRLQWRFDPRGTPLLRDCSLLLCGASFLYVAPLLLLLLPSSPVARHFGHAARSPKEQTQRTSILYSVKIPFFSTDEDLRPLSTRRMSLARDPALPGLCGEPVSSAIEFHG